MNFFISALFLLAVLQGVQSTCINGYEAFGNSCYKVSGVLDYTIFVTAASKCQAEGGDLATITNAFTSTYILQLAEKHGAFDYWIGLKCPRGNVTACHWIKENPPAFRYSNFDHGFPAKNTDCTAVSINSLSKAHGKWFTSPCSNTFRYICEQKPIPKVTTTKKSPVLVDAVTASSMMEHPKNIKEH